MYTVGCMPAALQLATALHAVPQDLDDHMDCWSEVAAQLEHGMVSVDLPALPSGAAVPLVRA